jgi:AraC-like DNA-binding protein
MPRITVQGFTDPDHYHAAIRNLVTGVVTARGDYRARLTRVDFDRVWLHRNGEELARVLHYTPSGQRATILFPTDQHHSPLYASGREILDGEITFLGYASPSHFRSLAQCHWGTISLPIDDIAASGEAILGRELTAPRLTRHFRPPVSLLSRLRNTHEAASRLAQVTPDILTKPEVARAIEQGLIYAMVGLLGATETIEVGQVNRTHAAAMRRLEEVLEASADDTLYIAELSAAAGVSDRTLRMICQAHLGMSPMRYLQLRRMHLARRALRVADPAATTVTEVATSYGFWELGRFSVAYRSVFGETPSATLRRAPDDPRPQKILISPWALPESA